MRTPSSEEEYPLIYHRPHTWEHLMIIFFDVMLVDDDTVMNQPYVRRRQRLQDLVQTIPGRADLATVQKINFSGSKAALQLLQALAVAFTQRWEGYVLKPCDDPYVNFDEYQHNRYRSCWFKLKRDYIKGLGDTADLAIVGAGYDAEAAKRLGLTGVKWTYFHVGCLQNKGDVLRTGAKPKFLVIDALNQSITKSDLKRLCQLGQFVAEPSASHAAQDSFDFSICSGLLCQMDTVFRKPFVFEVMGSGFDKPPNRDHFTLRFPRVVKILWDKTFMDAVCFDELQVLATEARAVPEGDISSEVSDWLERIRTSESGKGSVLSWGHSQDNDSGCELVLTSPTQSPRSNTRPSKTDLFIRTDTEELVPIEMRLKSGQLKSRPSLPHSSMTDATGTTLLTPADTSPKNTCSVAEKQASRRPRSSQLPTASKRKADLENIEKNPRTSKRRCFLRPSDSVTDKLDSSPSEPKNLNCEGYTSALSEITNSARQYRPTTRHQTTTMNSKGQPRRLALVRKMTLGTEVKPYMNKKEKPPPLSSSVRETTVSEDSSSPRSPSSFSACAFNSTMPSSPPPQAAVPPSRTQAIPDFSNCITVLSPCISQTPYLTEDLLTPFDGIVLSSADISSLTASQSHDKQIILLVESRRSNPTGRFLRSLYPTLRQCRQTIEIWDWRVLEPKVHGAREGGDNGKGKGRTKCFIGRMQMTGVTEARIEWASGPASVFDREMG